jgi:hypothetical protein
MPLGNNDVEGRGTFHFVPARAEVIPGIWISLWMPPEDRRTNTTMTESIRAHKGRKTRLSGPPDSARAARIDRSEHFHGAICRTFNTMKNNGNL